MGASPAVGNVLPWRTAAGQQSFELLLWSDVFCTRDRHSSDRAFPFMQAYWACMCRMDLPVLVWQARRDLRRDLLEVLRGAQSLWRVACVSLTEERTRCGVHVWDLMSVNHDDEASRGPGDQ
jgi:hypothetical protein